MNFERYPLTGTYRGDLDEIRKRIRAASGTKKRKPCHICKKHEAITHLHHLVPVRRMAVPMMVRRIYSGTIHIPTVWVCPNHHAYLHFLQSIRAATYKNAWEMPQVNLEGSIAEYEELLSKKHYQLFVDSLEAIKPVSEATKTEILAGLAAWDD